MDCSTPGLPVHHQFPEFTQTHVHRVSDAIQPSHPLSPASPSLRCLRIWTPRRQGICSVNCHVHSIGMLWARCGVETRYIFAGWMKEVQSVSMSTVSCASQSPSWISSSSCSCKLSSVCRSSHLCTEESKKQSNSMYCCSILIALHASGTGLGMLSSVAVRSDDLAARTNALLFHSGPGVGRLFSGWGGDNRSCQQDAALDLKQNLRQESRKKKNLWLKGLENSFPIVQCSEYFCLERK